MEPYDGSTVGPTNLPSIFQQHRGGKNNNLSVLAHDASLDSGYLTTSNNTPNISLSSSATSSLTSVLAPPEITTPERFSGNNLNSSNLSMILEHNEPVTDSTKLTPVTQNIQNICNFHITTPKDVTGTKRNVAAMLNFQDFESTPKKPRFDDDYHASQIIQAELVSNTTPRKTAKLRSKKQSFRKKLKSAPDLDVYFNVNNSENEPNSRQENISPIFDKSASRGSRTPLSSSSSNLLRISTPKSSTHKGSYGGLYPTKPSSVKKLLTFTESQFEQLLGADKKEDLLSASTVKMTPPATVTRIGTASATTSSTKKCLAESFVRASQSHSNIHDEQNHDHDLGISVHPLTFDMTAKSEDFCDISLGPTSLLSKKITAVTSEVLRDRELSRRHLSSSKVSLKSQFNKWSDSNGYNDKTPLSLTPGPSASTKTTKKDKTETESQGFQDILNISNDCLDMEISAICTENSILAEAEENTTANYNIPSTTDLTLNDSIVCEEKSPAATSSAISKNSLESFAAASLMRVPLPRTPKKIKPISFEHERLGILYPMIRRTPSKYNPLLRRTATKRKLQQDLSSTFKRHRKYYGGNTYLNIIAKLVSYDHLLERIFRCLTAADLKNACEVSKTWRQAVQSNRWAWNEVRSYLNNCQSLKENNERSPEVHGTEVSKEVQSRAIEANEGTFQKIPFNQTNVRIDRKRSLVQNRSPPVSPSKRKFHENQKIVRTLAPNEKLLKCPRCNKSSRIYNALLLDHHNNNNRNNVTATSTNRLSHIRSLSQTFHSVSNDIQTPTYYSTSPFQSFHQVSQSEQRKQRQSSIDFAKTISEVNLQTNIVSSKATRFVKSLSYDSATTILPDAETSQYAECSGLSCSFRFCLECQNEYHPGEKCKLFEPSSPSKDDGSIVDLMQSGMVGVRSGKSIRRKTLKRLCF